MNARTIILTWLIILIAFAGYGFLGPGLSDQPNGWFNSKTALEPTIMFSGVGFCFGAYLSAGLVTLKLVRRARLYRVWAVLLLALLAVLCVPIPMGIVFLAEKVTISGMRLYQKELFYFPTAALYLMFWIASGTFLILTVCVSSVTSCPLLTRSLHSTPR